MKIFLTKTRDLLVIFLMMFWIAIIYSLILCGMWDHLLRIGLIAAFTWFLSEIELIQIVAWKLRKIFSKRCKECDYCDY